MCVCVCVLMLRSWSCVCVCSTWLATTSTPVLFLYTLMRHNMDRHPHLFLYLHFCSPSYPLSEVHVLILDKQPLSLPLSATQIDAQIFVPRFCGTWWVEYCDSIYPLFGKVCWGSIWSHTHTHRPRLEVFNSPPPRMKEGTYCRLHCECSCCVRSNILQSWWGTREPVIYYCNMKHRTPIWPGFEPSHSWSINLEYKLLFKW